MALAARSQDLGFAEAPALLGVERSLKGRRWQARLSDDQAAFALSQALGVPDALARVLAGRGVPVHLAAAYLRPSLKADMPDPSVLGDMDLAAARVARSLMAGETIGLFGDYDVDGATSSAIITRFIKAVGGATRIYIPDRFREGYGPNAAAFARLAGEGLKLVLTLDCGTRSHEPIAAANAKGLDVVVIDHHLAAGDPPPAFAMVNPNKPGEVAGLGALCTAGLAFLFCVALNRTLRAAGWYGGRPEPNLIDLLDLVALGTVCDVVPLAGLNRTFVTQGIKIMRQRRNVGLAALADVAKVRDITGPYELGFLLGPRINAGGRLADSSLGSRLLTTDDPQEARRIAQELDRLNRERRAIEAGVEEAAIEQAERLGSNMPVLVLHGDGWHPGVVGIVAGRLKDKFNKPTLVLGVDVDNQGELLAKGSGRSVAGVDLGTAVSAAEAKGLILRGGGHAMAVGLTATPDQIAPFADYLAERLAGEVADASGQETMLIDAVVSAAGATRALHETLAEGGPYGQGNPEPQIVVSPARITYAAPVGDTHMRCTLEGPTGGQVRGIAWRVSGTPIGDLMAQVPDRWIHVAGSLKADNWGRANGVQLVIDDMAIA